MPFPTFLDQALEKALTACQTTGILYDAKNVVPTAAADFITSDYLSISSNVTLRHDYLKALETTPYLFGARGSRIGGGTGLEHLRLEAYFRDVFNAPAAIVLNNGYTANLAFMGSVPQSGDVLLYDSQVHASLVDGMQLSRARDSMIAFEHNSLQSLEAKLKKIVEEYPLITSGNSTLFVIVESTYSMHGDFCPLPELVNLLDNYIPREAAHIVVDEAHSVGLFGPKGRGLISLWGLQERINTVILTLTKGINIIGAVILTSPTIASYMVNYARPFGFGTALPFIDIIAIKQCFSLVIGPIGDKQRQNLQKNAKFFSRLLQESFADIPPNLLSCPNRPNKTFTSTSENETKTELKGWPFVTSPVFPILSSKVSSLQQFLHARGYIVGAVAFPVVPKGFDRLRVVIHAGNSEKEMVDFVWMMRSWALFEMGRKEAAGLLAEREIGGNDGGDLKDIRSNVVAKL